MRIGELSKKLGIDVETIRFYEREGLIKNPLRERNGYRDYADEQVQQLAFVRHCRALGMSLEEIRWLRNFIATPNQDCSAVNILIARQLKKVSARLTSLRALKRQLDLLKHQCTLPRRGRECGILQELVAAAQGEACVCRPREK